MKGKLAIGLVSAALFSTNMSAANIEKEERFSVGFGLGLHYTGMGVSVARQTDNSVGYVSIGCLGWNSDGQGNCGVSGGFMSNFNFKNPRMTLGFFIVGTEDNVTRIDPDTGEDIDSALEEIRIGSSFNYHFGGLKSSGVVAGLSGHMYKSDDQTKPRLGLHVGYQW